MRNTLILISFLAFAAVLFGVNYFFRPFAPRNQVDLAQITPTPKPTPTPSVDETAKAALTRIFMVPLIITPETKEVLPSWIGQNKPAAVVIYGSNVDLPTIDSIKEKLALLEDPIARENKVMLATVFDGGENQALSGEGFTPLPSWQQLCRQNLPKTKTLLASAAAELAEANIDMVLSPSLDLSYAPSSATETTCSSNPQKVIQYSQAFIKAMDQWGILSVAKHFPGVGKLKVPLNQEFSVISVTKNDLLPFKDLLETTSQTTNQRAVMVSLAGVKQSGGGACALTKECVDQVINASDHVLIVSDDLSQKAAFYDPETKDYTKSLGEVAYEAVMAGNNLLYFGRNLSYNELDQALDYLAKKYQTDPMFKAKVEVSRGLVNQVMY